MSKKNLALVFLGMFFSSLGFAYEKEIAITIDDLPFVGTAGNNQARLQREHDRFMAIMQPLVDNKVPTTGFVIANSIEKDQWQLLEAFKDAGFIIGNHTYSHANLNTTTAAKYIANIDKADKILEPLMTSPKYFRYPYLAEGKGDKKAEVLTYLRENDYVIAPVTIDSKDFLFNQRLYAIPYRLREKNINQLKQKYLAYIWNQTLKAEQRAPKIEGKPVKQILLIHANLLNSYAMGDIIELYQKNGYRFISLPEALEGVAPTVIAPVEMPKESVEKTAE